MCIYVFKGVKQMTFPDPCHCGAIVDCMDRGSRTEDF